MDEKYNRRLEWLQAIGNNLFANASPTYGDDATEDEIEQSPKHEQTFVHVLGVGRLDASTPCLLYLFHDRECPGPSHLHAVMLSDTGSPLMEIELLQFVQMPDEYWEIFSRDLKDLFGQLASGLEKLLRKLDAMGDE